MKAHVQYRTHVNICSFFGAKMMQEVIRYCRNCTVQTSTLELVVDLTCHELCHFL